jgi:integrase
MLECSCRPEELFKLERKNVNLENGYLFVPFGKIRNAKRRIPLSMRAVNILDLRLAKTSGKYVFINERTGNPITSLKKAHHVGAIKRSKIAYFRIYDLRHSFALHFVESGGDSITIKDLLGYASLQMVLR